MVASRKYFCVGCGTDNIKLDPQQRMAGCPHCNASWTDLRFSNRVPESEKQEVRLRIQADDINNATDA